MKTNRKKNKTVAIASLVVAFLATSFGSAYAAAQLEPINAFFNRGVSFVLNGERWQPQNEEGRPLAAIYYDGNNYLPVRALAEALNIPIDFDPATQHIYIGAKRAVKTPMFAVPMEIDHIYAVLTRDPKETNVHDRQFGEVLKIDQYGDVILTLDRKFKRLVLDAAVVSPGEHEAEISLYNAGDKAGNTASTVLEMHKVAPDEGIKTLVFDVEGLDKVKLHVQSHQLNPYIYARILDTSFLDNGDAAEKDGSKATGSK
ncbi:hypothetical protein [Paenibacillus flagellatus]|uniref:Copper amine oxidase-like N-terminal domain-containing protein n=1 Tax=Paenibacillus flagellatus TaxID=2211139 RepID=A0A2V5K0Q8_9BACL|nr:hypothetical protein [Paenibacillus flagellatus]PYI52152.1 hypothetical protein DLM86_21995 [Paenibacillus flagellatus]